MFCCPYAATSCCQSCNACTVSTVSFTIENETAASNLADFPMPDPGDWNGFAEPSPGPSGRELRPLTKGPRWFEHTRKRLAPRLDRSMAQESC